MESNDGYLYDPRGKGLIENFNYYVSLTISSWIISLSFVLKIISSNPMFLFLPLAAFAIFYAVLWKKKRFLMPRIPLGYRSGMLGIGKFFVFIGSSVYLLSIAGLLYMLSLTPAQGMSGVPIGLGIGVAFLPSLIGIILIERVRRKAKKEFDEETT